MRYVPSVTSSFKTFGLEWGIVLGRALMWFPRWNPSWVGGDRTLPEPRWYFPTAQTLRINCECQCQRAKTEMSRPLCQRFHKSTSDLSAVSVSPPRSWRLSTRPSGFLLPWTAHLLSISSCCSVGSTTDPSDLASQTLSTFWTSCYKARSRWKPLLTLIHGTNFTSALCNLDERKQSLIFLYISAICPLYHNF